MSNNGFLVVFLMKKCSGHNRALPKNKRNCAISLLPAIWEQKAYCKISYKRVKCGMDNATCTYPKKPKKTPNCIHCGDAHRANYRGCKVCKD